MRRLYSYPGTGRGTYRTARAASLIDYYLVSSRLAAAVQCVEVVEATGIKGHTPVRLTFKPEATTLRALHLRRPPRIGMDRLYGPLPPPLGWAPARAAAERALRAARTGDGDVQTLLDDAYRQWADAAEAELASYVVDPPKKLGERGRLPRLVWRSVVP